MRGGTAPREVHPTDAAVEKYLYALGVGDDPYDDSIEVWLADNVDGPAAELIRKLIADGSLKGTDREHFAFVLAVQELRIPRTRDMVKRALAEIGTRMLQLTATHDSESIKTAAVEMGIELDDQEFGALVERYRTGDVSLTPTKVSWIESMAVADDVAPLVAALAWTVVDAPKGLDFVTSDAPVVKMATDPRIAASVQGVGWITPSAEITFPLDLRHVLLIRQGKGDDRIRGTPSWCRSVNVRTVRECYHFVYSRSREPFVEQIWNKFSPKR